MSKADDVQLSPLAIQSRFHRGIYAITNVLADSVYYGQSKHISTRLCDHRNDLVQNQHHCQPLQDEWNRYGEAAFVFAVVYLAEAGDLSAMERRCIREARSLGLRLLNVTHGNSTCTEERNRKIAEATHLRVHTLESRQKRSAKMRGRKLTEEHKQKARAVLVGRPVSEETRAKLAAQRGWKHTDATRQKIAEACRNAKPHGFQLGGHHTEEARQKMSLSQRRRRELEK